MAPAALASSASIDSILVSGSTQQAEIRFTKWYAYLICLMGGMQHDMVKFAGAEDIQIAPWHFTEGA